MTNEEAIKMLKSKMDGHTDTSYEWAETVRMAIKALESQPCEDCISRQAVIDINEYHHRQMPNHVNHEIWKEIKALPSVTPTSDAEDKYDIGYNCGYADAMSDIAESE